MFPRLVKVIRNPRWALRKVARMIYRKRLPGYCAVCGQETILYHADPRPTETYMCRICGAVARSRHLAIVLLRLLDIPEPFCLADVVRTNPGLKVYEAQAKGAIHKVLKSLPNYVCSEFFENVPPGSCNKHGIRCEDLQHLSFADDSFDLVITQAVFEHIRDPDAAWKEIRRVLKPGGYHLFTIPYFPDRQTRRRVMLEGDQDIFVLPKVYHGDGIRDGLVYTDFGYDLVDHLAQLGLPTRIEGLEGLDGYPHHIHGGQVFVSQKVV